MKKALRNSWLKIRKYGILRIPCKIIFMVSKMGEYFLTIWLPRFKKNPKTIKYLYPWISSFIKPSYKSGIPLMVFEVTEWLNSFLTKEMTVFEWGSGGSTIFFAKRVKKIISVECHQKWYDLISQLLEKNNLLNCEYLFRTYREPNADTPEDYISDSRKNRGRDIGEYCRAIDSYPNNFFDLVIIDGAQRHTCMKHAIPKVRLGGYLLLDDSDAPAYLRNVGLLKGWKQKDFFGPKPAHENTKMKKLLPTTIWQKPLSENLL